MKNKKNLIFLIAVLCFASSAAINAQSTDIDNPTVLTSATIEGEGDGKGETVFYTFNAVKGDVKITVDAKTDYYSTPVQIALLDEDGKELLPIYVVALGEGKREVKTKRFVRDQKVIVKITTRDDAQVKLLSYKIKLEGAIKVETPPMETPATTETSSTDQPTTEEQQTSSEQSTTSETPTETQTEEKKPKLKDKIKKKVKEKAKETVKEIIDN